MHRSVLRGVLPLLLLFAGQASAAVIVPDDSVKLEDLVLEPPTGWRLAQTAQNGDTVLAGFAKGAEYVTLYAKRAPSIDMRSVFVNGSQVTSDEHAAEYGKHQWTLLETRKGTREYGTVYVAAFSTTYRGNVYYGYSRAADQTTALRNAQAFLNATN